MSTNLDDVRKRLDLQLGSANKVLEGFKAEIADDIRSQVLQLFVETSEEMQKHVKAVIASEQRRLERQVSDKLRLATILSVAALLLSVLSFLFVLLGGTRS
jgi:hypothetical protein